MNKLKWVVSILTAVMIAVPGIVVGQQKTYRLEVPGVV